MSSNLNSHKSLKRGLLATSLSLAFCLGLPAFAADHLDSPAVAADPASDINDYYVFVNPNDADELIAVLTLNPLATGASQFSDAVVYDFWFEGLGGGMSSIQCTFSVDQRVNCTAPGNRSVAGPVGSMNVEGDFRVQAGLFDDPFFFDLAAFNTTVATLTPAFTDPGTDFFAGLNTLAIVIGIDRAALAPNGAADMTAKTYVTSARVGGTGINRGLNGPWWDSGNSGEGWYFSTYDVEGDLHVAAAYFGFDTMGNRYWLQGNGPATGNGATLEMREFDGGEFGQPLPTGTVTGVAHGTATVNFSSCTSGTVEYSANSNFPEYGESSYVLNNRPADDIADCQFFSAGEQAASSNKAHLAFQKERMGRPAINTALIPAARKDEYNASAAVSEWVGLFAADMAASLDVYDSLDGVSGNLLLGSSTALAGVLADDRLIIDMNVPTCGAYLAVELAGGGAPAACGGRTLDVDVIDATLGAAVGAAVSDNVDANDREFRTSFPFLADPN